MTPATHGANALDDTWTPVTIPARYPRPLALVRLEDFPRQVVAEGGTPLARLARGWAKGRIGRREVKRATGARQVSVLLDFAATYGNRPVANMSRADIERWIATRAHLAIGTRRYEVATLRQFVKWLQLDRHLRHDPMVGIHNPTPPRRVPRALPRTDIDALWAVLPDARARAIIALMRYLGLRRAEVLSIQVGDWDREANTMRVTGKGGHERLVPVTGRAAQALASYLAEAKIKAGPLIRRNDGSGPICNSHLGKLVAGWMTEAGVKTAAYDGRACHSLRHTLASEIADVEPDLRVVQMILGHASLSSTQVYLRHSSMAKVRAAMEAAE